MSNPTQGRPHQTDEEPIEDPIEPIAVDPKLDKSKADETDGQAPTQPSHDEDKIDAA
ncbi:MAG: hypothetical protein K2Q32_02720 [Alphaproteobacteria bacterium]|nr:hypothetical protein [Alphaproteobacteria bacterium]